MNILIVVPHPDDEVLGFGGVIQKHIKAGDTVFVNFLLENRGPRWVTQISQVPSVAKKLGYQTIITDTRLNENCFIKNVTILEEIIAKFKPDILYSVFGGDSHQDHDYTFKVVRIATRVWAPFLVNQVYLGEIPSSTDQAPKLPQFTFLPTRYVPLTDEEITVKIEAMKLYTEEVREWPHPRSPKGIVNLAERRGSECRQLYAESFVTLRDIHSFVHPKNG